MVSNGEKSLINLVGHVAKNICAKFQVIWLIFEKKIVFFGPKPVFEVKKCFIVFVFLGCDHMGQPNYLKFGTDVLWHMPHKIH